MFFSGDRLPGFSDTIEHPDGLVLVDTGMIDTTPAIEDDGEEWHPNPLPDELVSRVAVVVETDEGPVVLGGDVGDSFEELERGDTPGRQLVLELAAPTHLAHVAEVRVPHPRS